MYIPLQPLDVLDRNAGNLFKHVGCGGNSAGKRDDAKRAVDFIVGKKALAVGKKENLQRLYRELLNKDWFMTLLDLEDYIAVKDKVFADYEDREKWRRMMLVNIARAGFFSSDRTIAEYNRDIWKLK